MRTFGSYSHDTHNSIRQEAKGPAPAARGLGLESARAGRAFATIAVLDVHALWRASTRCSVFTRPLGDWRTAGHQAAASSLLAVSSFDGCAVCDPPAAGTNDTSARDV